MRQTIFKGTVPAQDPLNLPDGYAQKAINCRMDAAVIEPWHTPVAVATPTKTGVVKTIYRFGQTVVGDAQYWFNLLNDGKFAKGPVADDSSERTYFTEAGQPPRVTDITLATGTDLPSNWRILGVPQPKGTLSASVSNRGIASIVRSGTTVTVTTTSDIEYAPGSSFAPVITGADQAEYNGTFSNATVLTNRIFSFTISSSTAVTPATGSMSYHYDGTAETRLYTYTWVNDLSQQGAPWLDADSTPLKVIVMPGQIVTLSGFESSPAFSDRAGNVIAKEKRLYRSTGSSYIREDVLSVAQATYVSSVTELTGQLTLEAPYYLPPPADAQGIIALDGEIMAMYRGQTWMPSVRSLPHAWPTDYWMDVPYPIVGHGRITGGVIICTTAKAFLVSIASDPASATMPTFENSAGCVSGRSIVSTDYGVFYASPDGLMLATASGVSLVTDTLMTRDQWQALKPESILGAFYNKRYFGFYDNGTTQGAFILRTDTGELTWTDVWASAAYVEPRTNSLYLVISGAIKKWDAGSSYMTMTYRTKQYLKPAGGIPAAKILASGPLTFRHYRDGALSYERTVSDPEVFNLKRGRCKVDEFEFTGAAKVTEFAVGEKPGLV